MRASLTASAPWAVVLLGVALGATTPAAAQTPTAQPAPVAAKTRVQARLDEIGQNPYMTYRRQRDWTVSTRVLLLSLEPANRYGYLFRPQWEFSELTVVFPRVVESATAVAPNDSIRGELRFRAQPSDDTPDLVDGASPHSQYAVWVSGPDSARSVRLRQIQDMVCWDTVFHEDRARRVDWPTGPWPDDAEATFAAQQWVSPIRSDPTNQGPVNDLLNRWTNGEDPKRLRPVDLAKYLTRQVLRHVRIVRPAGNLPRNTRGPRSLPAIPILEGLRVQTAEDTARLGTGTRSDLAVLLTAVLRAAGLPTRIVAGYDEEESTLRQIRLWVEFCLYDEPNGIVTWVPVDVIELHDRGAATHDLDLPWKFFGTSDRFHEIVPIAYDLHPPTRVRAFNSPALYGIDVEPNIPSLAEQSLEISVTRTPRRASPVHPPVPAEPGGVQP